MKNLKEIENRHYKECDVVMLPTKDESVLSKAYLANPSYLRYNSKGFKYDSYLNNDNQHLYITSDDQIKEGDWSYIEHTKTIVQQNIDFKEVDDCIKKIIATTDKSLITDIREWKGETLELHENLRNGNIVCKHLPQPSQSFIKKYCELGGIDKVLVEYVLNIKSTRCGNVNCESGVIVTGKNRLCKKCNPIKEYKFRTDSHNTITIKSVKTTYDITQVVSLLKSILYSSPELISKFPDGTVNEVYKDTFDAWLQENLNTIPNGKDLMWKAWRAANVIFEDEIALREEFERWYNTKGRYS